MGVSNISMIKYVELVLTIIIFVLHYNSVSGGDGFMITTGTYFGFMIVLAGVFIGLCTGSPISSQVDMFFMLVGAILYISSGVMTYNYFNNYSSASNNINNGIIKAWLSIANGVVFVVDAVLTYRR